MLDALSGLKPALKWNRRNCESLIFYLNYRMTFLVLLFCCILISTQQFIGHKINCMSKNSDNKNEFLNDYCWAASTYSVQKAYLKEVGVNVPHPGVGVSEQESEYEYRNYYQYVHIVLFIQAVLFYVPHFIWKITEPRFLSRIPQLINETITETKETVSKDEDELSEEKERDTKVEDESSAILLKVANFIKSRRGSHKHLVIKYLVCEILATINVLGQTYLLDIFFYGKFLNLGLWFEVYYNSEILSDPIRLFPLVTVCKFRRYGPTGYINVINSLCVLPMNALNGKIFLCLWIWFTVLFFLSLCHLVYFVSCMLIPAFRILPLKIRSLLSKISVEGDSDQDHYNSYVKLIIEGDIGDWFVFISLKSNMDPVNFHRIADIIMPEISVLEIKKL